MVLHFRNVILVRKELQKLNAHVMPRKNQAAVLPLQLLTLSTKQQRKLIKRKPLKELRTAF